MAQSEVFDLAVALITAVVEDKPDTNRVVADLSEEILSDGDAAAELIFVLTDFVLALTDLAVRQIDGEEIPEDLADRVERRLDIISTLSNILRNKHSGPAT